MHCREKEVIDLSLELLEEWFEIGLRSSFGFDGAHYGGSIITQMLIIAEIMARCGMKDCRQDVRFKRFADFVIHETVYSRGWINNINDCNLMDASLECMYLAGVLHQRSTALWHWDRFNLANERNSILSIAHPDYVPNDFWQIHFHLLWPDDHFGESLSPAQNVYPLAKHFRDRGLVSMRSGWDPESLHVTLKSGREEKRNHQNADQNQVTLYALGEAFVIDSGYVIHTNADGRKSEAHNTIQVDDHGQTTKWGFEGASRGRILDFKVGEHFAYGLGDAKEAYAKRGCLNRAERHLQSVWDPRMPNHTVWVDDFDYDGKEHMYTLLIHTAQGNSFSWEKNLVTIHGLEHVMDLHLFTNLEYSIEESLFDEHPCLKIRQKGVRVNYILLCHPRKKNEPQLDVHTEIDQDKIEVIAKLNQIKLTHQFDTSEPTEFYSGERIERSKLIWTE